MNLFIFLETYDEGLKRTELLAKKPYAYSTDSCYVRNLGYLRTFVIFQIVTSYFLSFIVNYQSLIIINFNIFKSHSDVI